MKTRQISLAASLFAATAFTAWPGAAHAQEFDGSVLDPALLPAAVSYTETGDAGQTIGTAQATGAVAHVPLNHIFGTLSSPTDADIFAINIATATTFSISTNNATTLGSGLDTTLCLFDSVGDAIALNNNTSGGNVTSTLPAGNVLYAKLAPGKYYIGISLAGNAPVNALDNLIFAPDTSGKGTDVRGPALENGGGDIESNYRGTPGTKISGAYEIDLAGTETALVPVPEPSPWAALALGSILSGVPFLRRKTSSV